MQKAVASVLSERINNGRLVDQVYTILRQAIMSWHFKPGDRLLQKDLALELGVSQMVIREALSRLAAEGLVVTQPYKGKTAAPYSLQDIEDLYGIRLLLEGRALELAAEHITAEELAQMRRLLPQTSYDVDHPISLHETLINHRAFHDIPIQASGQRFLIRILKQIWDQIDPYLRYSPELRDKQKREELVESSQNDLFYHTQLLEALEARDGKKARQIHENHLLDGFVSLKGTMMMVSEPESHSQSNSHPTLNPLDGGCHG